MRTFFSRVWLCLSSMHSYKDLKKKTFWNGFWHLYFVLLMVCAVFMVPLIIGLFAALPHVQPFLSEKSALLPGLYPEELVLTFSPEGTLTTNVKEPYVVESLDAFLPDSEEDPEAPQFEHFLTIDTSAKIDDYPKYNSMILFTETSAVGTEDDGIKAVFYSKFTEDMEEPLVINKEKYESIVASLMPVLRFVPALLGVSGVFAILVLPWVMAGGWLLWLLLYLLVFTLLSWALAAIMSRSFGYASLYILGFYVLTVPVLVTTVLGFIGITFPFLFTLIFLVVMGLALSAMTKKGASKKA